MIFSQKQIHNGTSSYPSGSLHSGGLQSIQLRVLHMTGKATEPPLALSSHFSAAFRKYLWTLQTLLFAHTNGWWALSSALSSPGYQCSLLLSPVLGLNLISLRAEFGYFQTILLLASICYEYLSMFLALFSFEGFLWNSQEKHFYTSIYKYWYTLNALQMNHKR